MPTAGSDLWNLGSEWKASLNSQSIAWGRNRPVWRMIGRATCRHGREQSLIGTKGSSPDQDRTRSNDRRELSYGLERVGIRGIRFCCPGSLRSRERRKSTASGETWSQPGPFPLTPSNRTWIEPAVAGMSPGTSRGHHHRQKKPWSGGRTGAPL